MDHTMDEIPYTDFVNKELILFSMADNIRSIPSIVDGLKPGQRKIMFACFKRNLKNEIKRKTEQPIEVNITTAISFNILTSVVAVGLSAGLNSQQQ